LLKCACPANACTFDGGIIIIDGGGVPPPPG